MGFESDWDLNRSEILIGFDRIMGVNTILRALMGGLIDLMGFNAEYILYNILLKTNNLDTVSSENGLLTPSKPLYIDGTYKVVKH